MPHRRFLKRVLPRHEHIRGHRRFRLLDELLDDPQIFHLTRRSAAGGVANGLFMAFIPVPGHMLLAAVTAILLRVNLPLSIVLVWISNPITLAPQMILAYKVGAKVLHESIGPIHFEMSLRWMGSTLMQSWEEMLLGCFILATAAAILGYLAVDLAWRTAIMYKAAQRRKERRIRDKHRKAAHD